MSQHDYNIANQAGAAVRADINALAQAIATLNSGAAAPTTTFGMMFWYDSTNSLLKIRDPANTTWITLATVSGSTFTFASSLFSVPVSTNWFGTTVRFPQIDTSGVMEVGASLDFHPDAAGSEDYRSRISRATGANGLWTFTQTGTLGINMVPGAGGFQINGNVVDSIPVGMFGYFGGTAAPSKWLFCYGQNVSRTTYAALFALFSTTYGAGDGSTTFGLPDLRGRTIAGKDNMGGTSANRLTGLSGGVNGDNLGAAGGLETHTLTEAQLASHDHSVDPPNTATTSNGAHNHDITLQYMNGFDGPIHPNWGNSDSPNPNATETVTTTTDGAHTHTVNIAAFNSATAGSDAVHNNVQPTFILNVIVFAGV